MSREKRLEKSTPPDIVRQNKRVRADLRAMTGTFDEWMQRSKELKSVKIESHYCKQRAYFDSDDLAHGFYQFYKDIIVNPYLDDKPHRRMAEFIIDPHRFRMLQACRDTFKSNMGCVGYSIWRICREVLLTGESSLRILFASENLELAKRNLRWVRLAFEWNLALRLLCGVHKPQKEAALTWGTVELISAYRRDPVIGEPTVMAMGSSADRAGFHFDLIITDDLEAQRKSASRMQIEQIWDFYRLLHSILHRGGEMLILSTRWHIDDIYFRIEEQNKIEHPDHMFKVLKIPDKDKDGNVNFPTILPEHELNSRKIKHGSKIYSGQYQLNPRFGEERVFHESWIKWARPNQLEGKKVGYFTSADFAWTETSYGLTFRTESRFRQADYTAVLTFAVDEEWNYVQVDGFRSRCSKLQGIEECFRQYFHWGSTSLILQKYDRSQISDAIEQMAYNRKRLPHCEWIIYPATQKKVDRIEANVAPIAEQSKLYLMPSHKWIFTEEMADFPHSKFKDGLDCICNIVAVSKPAPRSKPRQLSTPDQRRIAALKAGRYEAFAAEQRGEESWKNV